MLFLAEDDYKRQCDDITETFRWKVPHRFQGYPTNFGAPFPAANVSQPRCGRRSQTRPWFASPSRA